MMKRCIVLAVLAGALFTAQPALAAGPTNTTTPLITGTAAEGQQLAASQGVWDNTANAPSTFSYQWQRCSGSCVNIPWAVNPGYVPGRADVGSTIKVVVTATSSGGSTAATSSATATVTSNGQTAYYVDGNSVGGTCSDSATLSAAQSPTTPWCTVTHAVSALATTATGVDVLVRGHDNAGTQQAYSSAGNNGRLNLTNDSPTGTVTIEAYGTASQTDKVVLQGILGNATSNYTFQGLDIGDPADLGLGAGGGCPYVAVQDIGGNLPAADYCLPGGAAPINTQLDAGSTNLAFYDDSFPAQIDFATTTGQGCPGACVAPSGITLYGSEVHNTGYNCTAYSGMTTTAAVNHGTSYTSIPVNTNTELSGGGGSGSGRFAAIYTGSLSAPTTFDTFPIAAGSTSTSIGVSSTNPANSYSSGANVIAESCPNNSAAVGVFMTGFVNNLTVSHSQVDHINCPGIEGSGSGWTFTYNIFNHLEPAWGNGCHADTVESTGVTSNFVFSHNLMYDDQLGIFAGCNPGGQKLCGTNWTITNNVCIAIGDCFEFGNYVSGTNYILNNTTWDGGQNGGTIFLRWSDACCRPGAATNPGPLPTDYVENNITDFISDSEAGSSGNATQIVAAEDYNVIADSTSSATCSGGGCHDIFNTTPSFATGLGSNCLGFSYSDSNGSCGSAATGFNAALLSGSTGIGAGTNGGSIPTDDFLGCLRTVPYDIGAFEPGSDSCAGGAGGGGGGGGGGGSGGNPLPLPPFVFAALGGLATIGGAVYAILRKR